MAPGTPQFFEQTIRPLTELYCLKCHSKEKLKGDLDLERFTSFKEVKKHPEVWRRVLEQLEDGEMPPEDKPQPAAEEKKQLMAWTRSLLEEISLEQAGDPGRVVLRRLSNAEYTYTVRDLTGVQSLDPAREFPVDGAAGEGFTNASGALSISPALVTKYLDAAKEIASHAVLDPDGFHFSAGVSRRDWGNETSEQIREFYRQFTDLPDERGKLRATRDLKSEARDPNAGWRTLLGKYLLATIEERDALAKGTKTPATVARERQLSGKYLDSLWKCLTGTNPTPFLTGIRDRWRTARASDVTSLVEEVGRWQDVLWKFNPVGLLGDNGEIKTWQEPLTPLAAERELKLMIPTPASGDVSVAYLAAGTAGDGPAGDFVAWEKARVIFPNQQTLFLRDVPEFVRELTGRRERIFAAIPQFLAAVAEARGAPGTFDVAALAKQHGVPADTLGLWLDYLGIDADATGKIELFEQKLTNVTAWDFIQGWGFPDAPGLVANPKGNARVRIPGIMMSGSVSINPSATKYAAVGWRSPVAGSVRIEATVYDQYPEAGNGFTWVLEVRRGRVRQRLASGVGDLGHAMPDTGSGESGPGLTIGPLENIAVQPGDLVALLIGPRNGDSLGDLTELKLKLTTSGPKPQEWSLTPEVSGNVLAGNPHADAAGNPAVWNFYSELVPVGQFSQPMPVIPAGSLMARWLAADSPKEKKRLAVALGRLLTGRTHAPAGSPDAALYRQLNALSGPLLAIARTEAVAGAEKARATTTAAKSIWALEPERFGRHPNGAALEPTTVAVRGPSLLEIRLPAELFAGCELLVTGKLLPDAPPSGSVQVQLLETKPASLTTLEPGPPVLARRDSPTWARFDAGGAEFRHVFPAALCYAKMVPMDEPVVLVLFHREDDRLAELMLDDDQKVWLDRMWERLHYTSHDALAFVDVYADLIASERPPAKPFPEFPTAPSKPPADPAKKAASIQRTRAAVLGRAEDFRHQLEETQPKHLDAVVEFAARASRRPLTVEEKSEFRALYRRLRKLDLDHDAAIRLTLARTLMSPAFLYRAEEPGPTAEPVPVRQWELASRLSYFLWASGPDAELSAAAAAGKLRDPAVLTAQTRRMLQDDRVRRLATEFGCAWMHIYGFDQLDEKSEKYFPTFVGLRGDMYEESIRFLTDLFQQNRSVLNVIDADYAFLNEALAKHYGIPGITGPEWRRVDGVKQYSRGGILGQATVLTKYSGASRTSPILRGNWVLEVLLGDRLPPPPKSVPQLPAAEATESLTVRQLTQRHTSDPRCSSCHAKIDPYGFALEGFDAIGRWREKDLANHPIDTKVKVADGTQLQGFDSLRAYLLTMRRDAFLYQFCRKLLGYAVGRTVHLSDEPLLKEMQAALLANQYEIGAAVEKVVMSRQFQEIRGREFALGE